MANFKIEWQENDFYKPFTNRHFPKNLHKRVKNVANELDTSMEVVMNEAIRLGVGLLENEVFSGKLNVQNVEKIEG